MTEFPINIRTEVRAADIEAPLVFVLQSVPLSPSRLRLFVEGGLLSDGCEAALFRFPEGLSAALARLAREVELAALFSIGAPESAPDISARLAELEQTLTRLENHSIGDRLDNLEQATADFGEMKGEIETIKGNIVEFDTHLDQLFESREFSDACREVIRSAL